ncbi:MAG: 4-hydroxythreonine-4-phosphate dehydrogenase PdxA [Myxococcales bacterium]|nr:4-hydroxythreonine-4-phosphate dehydrogenase PdxA [Myxococcales bacterium]MCB9750119.1 4-hydroxythreonine-4-phosphate dehydrogenase PdxA [Myxococcales bacterium]
MNPRPPKRRGPRLILTQGDPEGIGPELLLHVAAAGALEEGDRVVADRSVLRRLATHLGTEWGDRGFEAIEPLIVRVPGVSRSLGQVAALTHAVDLVLEDPDGHALVTAPIDKARCRDEGFEHPGHTEYLAHRAGVEEYAMLMVGPRLRVVLATIHVPLRAVAELLTNGAIATAGRLLATALDEHFGIPRPRIGVLGLNPHAGERGLLGHEERDVIAPAVHALQSWAEESQRPYSFVGPMAADTAFPLHAGGEYDGLVAMYHDQGLGPFKLLHMSDGVNMTLGLPFMRTSPDHGTARDIAGLGLANPASMLAAVALARGRLPRARRD